jgi:signal transduction histidine kinase
MHLQGYLLLAIAIPNIVLGSFILLRNSRDLTNVFFGAFILTAALWSLGLSQFIFTNKTGAAIAWAEEYYLAAACIPVLFLAFAISFTGNIKRLKTWQFLLIAAMLGGALLLVLTPNMLIEGIQRHDWGKEVILNKKGYLIYTLYFVLIVAAGFIVLLRALKSSRGIFRTYLKFLTIGLAIAYALGMTFNLFFPVWGNYEYIWVGPLFTLVYISTVSYAIVRHRLFDIRLFAVRALAYGITLAVISFLYLIPAILLTNYVLDANLKPVTMVLLAVITLMTATVFQNLRGYFNRTTSRIFFRDYYEPQDVLDKLSSVLVESVDLDRIKKDSASILKGSLKASKLDYLLRAEDKEGMGDLLKTFHNTKKDMLVLDDLDVHKFAELHDKMSKNDVALAVRLITRHEELGYMVLGFKESGSPYSIEDQKLLGIAADEIAIGLQNAFRFEQIRQFNLTLQQKVEEATKELRHANTKLKELDKTKDEFISMASHQLRTPLTTIKGYLSMVLEGDAGPIKPKQREMIEQSFESASRMVYLIADLLNVSRLQSGKFVIINKPCNLADVVEGEVKQLAEQAKSRKITMTYDKPKEFPALNLDEDKVRQVVMNLLDNALYYTPSDGAVTVMLAATPDSVSYTVTDTGVGVPKAIQPHLFTKFYRADNARKMRPDGTGLGLYMAKKVITAQGGAIIFKSEEGKGSTFGFTFPRKRMEVKQ